ncbi:hypothetical protein Q5P01_000666 [Channa striata]|uniref:Uncharacterized protein n=1 Tax=Channa striata TaxID=64152 RepID=A0AA88IX38_CHASR|nr:hypothetical protein Q5P01_000666 [Channa striata]
MTPVLGKLWQGSLARVRDPHAEAATLALSVLMPKQHLEQTLHNLVRTHRAREARWFAWLTSPPTSKEKKRKGDRANEGNGVGEVCLLEVLRDSELTRRGPPGTLPELCDALCAFCPERNAAGPERPRSPLAEPPPLPPPTQLSEAEKTHQRNSRLSRRGSESNGYHENGGAVSRGLHDPQREPRSRAHTQVHRGSEQSPEPRVARKHPAETPIQRTTTYRDAGLAEPAPGGETAKIQGLGSAGKSR